VLAILIYHHPPPHDYRLVVGGVKIIISNNCQIHSVQLEIVVGRQNIYIVIFVNFPRILSIMGGSNFQPVRRIAYMPTTVGYTNCTTQKQRLNYQLINKYRRLNPPPPPSATRDKTPSHHQRRNQLLNLYHHPKREIEKMGSGLFEEGATPTFPPQLNPLPVRLIPLVLLFRHRGESQHKQHPIAFQTCQVKV